MQVDVGYIGLLNQGTEYVFGVCIVNLDTVSYLRMTPEKTLEKVDK